MDVLEATHSTSFSSAQQIVTRIFAATVQMWKLRLVGNKMDAQGCFIASTVLLKEGQREKQALAIILEKSYKKGSNLQRAEGQGGMRSSTRRADFFHGRD